MMEPNLHRHATTPSVTIMFNGYPSLMPKPQPLAHTFTCMHSWVGSTVAVTSMLFSLKWLGFLIHMEAHSTRIKSVALTKLALPAQHGSLLAWLAGMTDRKPCSLQVTAYTPPNGAVATVHNT